MDTSGHSPTSSDETLNLPPLVRREDLLTAKDLEAIFNWKQRTIDKYRTREHLPIPYIHVGDRYFYVWPQIAEWLNQVQADTMPRERELRELARRIR